MRISGSAASSARAADYDYEVDFQSSQAILRAIEACRADKCDLNTYRLSATGGFNVSDQREKYHIRRAQVTRGIALKVAKNFRSWKWKRDDREDQGVIAQWLKQHAPRWVREFERHVVGSKVNGRKVKRLSVDKAGLALDCAMDNALDVAELFNRLNKLERKIK
jgi:hypothetical protein